jgi:glutaconyl-CoA/methylmalonyl-CoA decarboxylase subunit gamma
MAVVTITQLANGVYNVEHDGRNEIIYVAGPTGDRWIFWNGQVFRGDFRVGEAKRPESDSATQVKADTPGEPPKGTGPFKVRLTSLTAPMPARVGKLLAQPGTVVKKGEVLIVLEAMKMELPVRAPADSRVTAVHCREGELVDTDAVLIELGTP